MATDVIDELLVGLGFEYDPEDVAEFKKELDSTTNFIKQLTKAAVVAATAITGLTVASTRASDEQSKLADEVGETVEMIDALSFANRRAGGSSDGMSNSLRELSLRASEAARGVGTGLEAFSLLGIQVEDSNGAVKQASELILEVSGRLQSFDRARQVELADKLGLRDSIRLLQQGPEEIRTLINEAEALGVTTAKDAAIATDFQNSLTDLWQITKQISRSLSREFAPILDSIVESMTDWWTENGRLLEQKLPEFIDQLIMSLKILSLILGINILSRIGLLVTSFIRLAAATRGATIATAALNAMVALLPTLITAGILLFIGLIEDAKTFFEGGESLIGDLINQFPKLRSEITEVAHVFNGIWEVTQLIVEGWKEIFGLVSKGLDRFAGLFPEGTFDASNLGGSPTGIQSNRSDFNFSNLLSAVGGTSMTPAQFSNQGGTSNSRQVSIGRVEIAVSGSDDPRRVAEEVFNRLTEQAYQDVDSPVDQ